MQNILVIDDDEVFRQTTMDALHRQGYQVHGAEDGNAGVELARRLLPDLIMCDVNMDRLDGYSALGELRRSGQTASIPLILMTGHPDFSGMRHGMELGADDYLRKPFSVTELFATVNARLKKLAAVRQEAERKLADLRSSISQALPHELVTPLNGIMGLAQILNTAAETLSPAEVAEMGGDILQSAERLNKLVERFLLYTHLELASVDLEARAAMRKQRTAQLGALIEQRARVQAGKFNRLADLRLELSDGEAAIAAEFMTRLVDELLENAFKFSPAGTAVRVSSLLANARFIFSITDQGYGMEREQITEIGAYVQFNRKELVQTGAGLGLTIAKRLASVHGGTLEVTSQKGKGTTVTVSLPSL